MADSQRSLARRADALAGRMEELSRERERADAQHSAAQASLRQERRRLALEIEGLVAALRRRQMASGRKQAHGCAPPPGSVVTADGATLPCPLAVAVRPPVALPATVDVRFVAGRGRGLFARKDFGVGETVWSEEALLVASADERIDGGALIGRLHADGCGDVLCRLQALYGASAADPTSVVHVFDENAFAVCGDRSALFPGVSLLNHSCVANCVVDTGDGRHAAVRTVAAVRSGSELSFSYWRRDHGWSTEHRQRALQATKGFTCRCPLCQGADATRPLPPAPPPPRVLAVVSLLPRRSRDASPAPRRPALPHRPGGVELALRAVRGLSAAARPAAGRGAAPGVGGVQSSGRRVHAGGVRWCGACWLR
eukprot:TRINITY_DN11449_c0_g1_i5.p2 TRINITY_DN11449_c0_g1~~TRINITY_DN11449_c0_g1_i5.p2  ORF type:complete len:369 (+),score=98.39 TRINITY_DN11449_c0_g1_i5:57-1163(+)